MTRTRSRARRRRRLLASREEPAGASRSVLPRAGCKTGCRNSRRSRVRGSGRIRGRNRGVGDSSRRVNRGNRLLGGLHLRGRRRNGFLRRGNRRLRGRISRCRRRSRLGNDERLLLNPLLVNQRRGLPHKLTAQFASQRGRLLGRNLDDQRGLDALRSRRNLRAARRAHGDRGRLGRSSGLLPPERPLRLGRDGLGDLLDSRRGGLEGARRHRDRTGRVERGENRVARLRRTADALKLRRDARRVLGPQVLVARVGPDEPRRDRPTQRALRSRNLHVTQHLEHV